jgi:hypothetical protein
MGLRLAEDGASKPLDIARDLAIEAEVFRPDDPTSNLYTIP